MPPETDTRSAQTTRLHSPSKINLFLDVIKKRDDGFHELRTAFVEVDWCDEITLTEVGTRSASQPIAKLTVAGPFASGVPTDRRNLIQRALVALEKESGQVLPAYLIKLTKNVPHGAGLGAGSANAASVLRYVNATKELVSPETLSTIAGELGSDCAFFLNGGAAIGSGRGEMLEPIQTRPLLFVIAKPPYSISTKGAYAKLLPETFGTRSDESGLREWLSGEVDTIPELYNVFEDALDPLYPGLRRLRRVMAETGAVFAMITGSGSACFGCYEDEQLAKESRRRLQDEGYLAVIARTRNSDIEPARAN